MVQEIIRTYIEQDCQDDTDNDIRVEQEANVEGGESSISGESNRVESREERGKKERRRLVAFALRSALARRGVTRSGERAGVLGEP
jgi:hypothetical protein